MQDFKGTDQTLKAQMERDGIALPDNIANVPVLQYDLQLYLEAFYELDTERSHGMGLVRIPGSAIREFARHYGMDEEETVYFIRKMDDAHLDRLGAKLKNGQSTGPSEVVRRAPRPD